MSTVQVILSSYNGEKHIREQLNSILRNTYTDYTIEVWDDASTDGTVDIIKEYMQIYDNINLHVNRKNKGYIKNFLTGVAYSDAQYIMLCDQDDIWENFKIEKTLNRMIEEEGDGSYPVLVCTDAMEFDDKTAKTMGSFVKNSHYNMKNLDKAHLLMENKCIGCSIMVNSKIRDYLKLLPRDVKMHDWWLALICAFFGKVSYIDETTLHYRQHSGNMIGGGYFLPYAMGRAKNLSGQRETLVKIFRQAKAFYQLYGEKLNDEDRQLLEDFIAIPTQSVRERKLNVMKNGFYKSGLSRNAALLLIV